MTDKEWRKLELSRMVKTEDGKVGVEHMTEIALERSRRLRENPNLSREVTTLIAEGLIARAWKKTGEERYRIIKRILRLQELAAVNDDTEAFFERGEKESA